MWLDRLHYANKLPGLKHLHNFTATRLSSKPKYLQKSFSMKNGWSTEQQCINPLCATIMCLWSLQGWFTLQSLSAFPLHPSCHFASLSQSLILLLNFPARSPLFNTYLPSISQSFPYSCPPPNLPPGIQSWAPLFFSTTTFLLSSYSSVWLERPTKGGLSQPVMVPPLPLSNAT